MSNDYVFDIETYPNVFTLAVEHADAPLRWMFEISDWRNDSRDIIAFLQYLKENDARMVGFNNLGFDYPVLHTLIRMGQSDAKTLYQKAMAIIGSQDEDGNKWMHLVKPSDQFVTQIDLARHQKSGLVEAREVLKDVRGIAFTEFQNDDVVRHPLVARIIDAYDAYQAKS